MYNNMSKEAIGMKKIDVVQAQQDTQFIYNCYKKFDLDVDECRAVLKERDCCEYRDSDGHLLFDLCFRHGHVHHGILRRLLQAVGTGLLLQHAALQ